jgi:hypothetical protein
MPTDHVVAANHTKSTAVFYWIGVVMATVCFGLVFAGNTGMGWRFEHAGVPLSWVAAAAAILAFLASEFSHSVSSIPAEPERLDQKVGWQTEVADL